jgi:tight adherence protein C
MGAKLLLMVLLALGSGLLPFWTGYLNWQRALLWASAGCALGYLAPGFWLHLQVQKRQRQLRNALPDALDILVLCLEGGVSLQAAIQWVADELPAVHPDLGAEINIVEREMQLGLSAGEALRSFADRCGLSDVRDLASVVLQSERYGASVAKALRIYADTARQDRQQKAEESAQKASVKIVFPTLFCIFPAIFIVLLGPAAFQMAKLFSK